VGHVESDKVKVLRSTELVLCVLFDSYCTSQITLFFCSRRKPSAFIDVWYQNIKIPQNKYNDKSYKFV
jgi:hypothetical protein